MYGLAGSHRSGKTTLARDLAADLGIEFLETKVGDVFTDLGLDPKQPLSFGDRLDVQNKILRNMETQFALRNGAAFIADRTPFDVLGYTLADVQRDTLDDAMRDRVHAHVGVAVQVAQEYLRGVMLVRPLPDQGNVHGKAQACPVYMRHVYILIRDMLETVGHMSAELTSLDHTERMEDAKQFITVVNGLYESMEPEVKLWTPNS